MNQVRLNGVILIAATALIFLLIAAGCNMQDSSSKKQRQPVISEEIVINQEIAGAAKLRAGNIRGVKESAAVAINKELSVAIKVGGFDRLHLKSIREKVHDAVKEIDRDYNVYVTSDKKLFMRLQRIEQQTGQAREESLGDIGSEFKAINKDM